MSETGIFIRCQVDGKWGSHDIGEAPIPEVCAWLRSKEDGFIESLVMNLIGRGKEYNELEKENPLR